MHKNHFNDNQHFSFSKSKLKIVCYINTDSLQFRIRNKQQKRLDHCNTTILYCIYIERVKLKYCKFVGLAVYQLINNQY